ncbi:MAG: septal ring lytic transglycosylase RlpA family protein [Burkholderiales bacterium]|nr:MAG: septal ring lytic transglycosylase RlpA family protein [Burkholderiales bacterium]
MTTTRSPGRFRAVLPTAIVLALAACAAPQGRGSARAPAAGVPGAGASPTAPAAPATAPAARRGGYYLDDGPDANPPADLASIPDAVPRAEPLLPRTLRPYSVFGRQYTPMTRLEPFRERGTASWYGKRYHGQPTSSGERYDMYAMTAAHPTLPIPSYVRVTHTGNGRSVVARVNDRGPFLHDRVIDLSYTAAARLGYVEAGSAEVEVELITRFDGATTAAAAAPAPASAPAPERRPASLAVAVPTPATVKSEPPRLEMESVQPASEATRVEQAGLDLPLETVVATPGGAPMPASAARSGSSGTPAASPAAPHAAVASGPSSSSAPPDATVPPTSSAAPAPIARGFWLQLGAFGSLDNARSAMMQIARRLEWLGTAFDIRQEGELYKVQAGPWGRRDQALAAAERIRAATELRPFATLR